MSRKTRSTALPRAPASRSSISTSSAEASSQSTSEGALAPARVDILGVGFDRIDLTAAAERIIERHAAGQRTFVITANPEFVMLARRDADLGEIARDADLVVADGTGVLVASRVLRDPLPGRVPGRLLVPAVLQLASGPVFLLGASL